MFEDLLALTDWRRRIAELYAEVRAEADPVAAWRRWREVRDELFRTHPQSPIRPSERMSFPGADYYDYDPAARVSGKVRAEGSQRYDITTSGGGTMAFTRFARIEFELNGREVSLEFYWLEGYAGGLFLPFRDATSGSTTYGAGRYLLDSAKGADLGVAGDDIVLDFNFAYNPSCAYDPQWLCPLAPPPNRLAVAIAAGERTRPS